MAGAARARGLAPGRGQSRWTGEFSASASGENSRSSYTFVQVTAKLHAWFLGSPSLTARELLDGLQAEVPAVYPETLLRTLQRRVKVWRAEMARELVFGLGSGIAAANGREATGAATASTGVADAATGMSG